MKLVPLIFSFLALACSAGSAPGNPQDRHALAGARAETRTDQSFTVSSPSFPARSTIPLRHSAYGEGVSPALSWSGVPAGAQSLALMLEDPDAVSAKPFVHWLAWNIDPALGALPASVPGGNEITQPLALRQGRNNRGAIGYFGPRPPGSRPHHYHFQLFALDRRLELAGGADREALLAAMNGHVLAKGDLVGLFAKPRG